MERVKSFSRIPPTGIRSQESTNEGREGEEWMVGQIYSQRIDDCLRAGRCRDGETEIWMNGRRGPGRLSCGKGEEEMITRGDGSIIDGYVGQLLMNRLMGHTARQSYR